MRGLIQERPLLLSSFIRHAARWHPQAEVVGRTIDGRLHRYGYAEAEARARRLARALDGLGLPAGAVAGSLAWSCFRHFELFYGVSGSGRVLHTCNPRLFPRQIAYAIRHAGDRLMFVDAACLELAEELAPELPQVERWVVLADEAQMPRTRLPNVSSYDALLAGSADGYEWPVLDESAASVICYTSGTTGDPKGCVYSHRGSVLQAMAVCAPDAFGFCARDVILPIAPLFHCNGWSAPYVGPLTGARLVLPGRALDMASLHELIVSEGVTVALAVPTVWLSMLEHLRETGKALGRLERVGCGGSAPPPAMIEALERHGVRTIHVWGMTETTAGATFGQWTREEQASQGRPIYGCEVRAVDEAGRVLPRRADAVGRLEARGCWTVSGYYQGADDPHGWLDTGDVGSVDEKGLMRIADRAKDVIKSGGEWISSIALENAAAGHPDVLEAAAIGVPHPKWQERPLDAAGLRAWLAQKLARWQVSDEIAFADELPHTATGKISKRELRARYASPAEGGEASSSPS
jgi:3-(methylthio)propionyl---CoA ligase